MNAIINATLNICCNEQVTNIPKHNTNFVIKSRSPVKKTKTRLTKVKIKFIDLFAGIGGFHYALNSQDFQCVFTSEIDKNARLTYEHNFKSKCPLIFSEENYYLFNQDITTQNIDEIPDHDILCGGFPCQPFSIAGFRKGLQDEGRGDLIFTVVNIVKEKKPRVIFLENVKNLLTHDQGNTYKIIKDLIEKEGYYVTEKILNTMDYGNIPQNRERLYILAFKNKADFNRFEFPQAIKLTQKFNTLLETENIDSYYYYENKPLYERLKNDIIDCDKVYQWRRKYVRENKSGVCPTLTANMGTGGHNVPIIRDEKGIRKITPRECLRLQGFPEDFNFPKDISRGNQYKQIGNAVSIPVVKSIAQQIKLAISN